IRAERVVGVVVVLHDEDAVAGRNHGSIRIHDRTWNRRTLEESRQSEGEHTSLTRLALHFDAPLLQLDELLHKRETESRAAMLPAHGRIDLRELVEDHL